VVMCAAVSVMVCYRVGKRRGSGKGSRKLFLCAIAKIEKSGG